MDQPLEGAAQSSTRPWLLTGLVTLWFAAAISGLFVVWALAVASGQTFLYDARGALLFSGGITGARGHAGDNAGRSSIVRLLNRAGDSTPAVTTSTNVFGCSLFAAAKS